MKNLIFLVAMMMIGIAMPAQMLKPVGGFGVGFNNSGPIHAYAEVGMELNETVSILADAKQVFGINNWQAYSLKGGLMLYINSDPDEFIMPHVGATYFSYPLKYQLDSKVAPSIGIRWQFYNVSTDFTWSKGWGFISLGWQFKKLNRWN